MKKEKNNALKVFQYFKMKKNISNNKYLSFLDILGNIE